MSSHKSTENLDVSLDLEDFTPRQLRKLLSKMARRKIRRSMNEKDLEEDEDAAQSANDDVVNLHESHTGDSRAPKVKKDDLPIVEDDLEDPPEEGDDEEMIAKRIKKGRK